MKASFPAPDATFRVGQLVECIDDRPEPTGDPYVIGTMNGLKKGRIYTVR